MSLRTFVFQASVVALFSQVLSVVSLMAGGSDHDGNLTVATVQNIPGTANLENLAVRHNDNILLTSVSTSSLFQISPRESRPPILIADISTTSSLFGIAELQKDIFYVIGSNYSEMAALPGSNEVWEIDMRHFRATENGTVIQPARVSLVTRIPSARLFNGMCRLAPNDTSHLLIADSWAGTITKLNVDTGAFEVVIQDPTMASLPTGLGIGVNGVHVHNTSLFFTSLDQGLFARMPISLATGAATGPVESITTNITDADDFAISEDGKRVWIAMNGPSRLLEVDISGKTTYTTASSPLLMSDSSVAFGRTQLDRNTLYVTGAATANNGTVGHVVKVELAFATNSRSLRS